MHCANCRHDNAATTRFCTSCGAVLVESTPDGRRRRVLRPWGLLRSAPPTESPAMPDIVAAVLAHTGAPPRRRLDLRFTGGVAAVAIAGMLLYPYARALDAPSFVRDPDSTTEPVIAATAPVIAEAIIVAPPLVEPLPAVARIEAPKSHAATTTPLRNGKSQEAPPAPFGADPSPPVAPVQPMPVRDVAVNAAPPSPPAPPPDRWQPLKDALGRCAMQDGLIERAVCEQGARLANCDGYWGTVALCPAGRSDYGQ